MDRKGGGVACYVRSDLSYIEKGFSIDETENIFFEILLPKTKRITVGIIYRPPNQSNFLETLNENLAKLDTLKKESYILGEFNINLCQSQNHARYKSIFFCQRFSVSNILLSVTVSNDVKNYLQFCTMFGLT